MHLLERQTRIGHLRQGLETEQHNGEEGRMDSWGPLRGMSPSYEDSTHVETEPRPQTEDLRMTKSTYNPK